MRHTVCLILLWIVAVLTVVPATARDVFVSNTMGQDIFQGRHPETAVGQDGPVRSIGRALKFARQGDHIVIENTGQPYRESISLVGSRHGGDMAGQFAIIGNGAILDGSAPVGPSAWEHVGGQVFRFRPRYIQHQQLFLNDRPAARVVGDLQATTVPDLEPLEWCGFGSHIYFCVEPNKRPDDYPVTFAEKRVGITLFHVADVVITDLTVQGFQLDGINAHNSARGIVLSRITCRGNGRSGITVGGASTVDIRDSLVGNNGRAQLLTLPWSRTYLSNTELLSNTAPAWLNQGGNLIEKDDR